MKYSSKDSKATQISRIYFYVVHQLERLTGNALARVQKFQVSLRLYLMCHLVGQNTVEILSYYPRYPSVHSRTGFRCIPKAVRIVGLSHIFVQSLAGWLIYGTIYGCPLRVPLCTVGDAVIVFLPQLSVFNLSHHHGKNNIF